MELPSIKQLLEAGVHFGHQAKRWHPRMKPFIFTQREGIHVIDLDQTEARLKVACEFLKDIASKGGKIVFVSTKEQAIPIVRGEAEKAGALHVTKRWVGGTLTNFESLRHSLKRLENLKTAREKGELGKYTKKERLLIDREIDKLDNSVGGLRGLEEMPAALFIVDTKREYNSVREGRKTGVPIVGIVDTNADPTEIDYPVPGNDDAIRAIKLLVSSVAGAVGEGYAVYNKEKAKENKKVEEDK